jgi:hypothetical protein
MTISDQEIGFLWIKLSPPRLAWWILILVNQHPLDFTPLPYIPITPAGTCTSSVIILLVEQRLFWANRNLNSLHTPSALPSNPKEQTTESWQRKSSCQMLSSIITFSGVNQHNQNGIAERNIRTVCDRACTMLLHALLQWPQAVTVEMWPFALKLAVDIHNVSRTDLQTFTPSAARFSY